MSPGSFLVIGHWIWILDIGAERQRRERRLVIGAKREGCQFSVATASDLTEFSADFSPLNPVSFLEPGAPSELIILPVNTYK
jgi:hypothetical protein